MSEPTPKEFMPLEGTEHVDPYDNRNTVLFRLVMVGGYNYTSVKALPERRYAIRHNGDNDWAIRDQSAASEQFRPWLEYQWSREGYEGRQVALDRFPVDEPIDPTQEEE